MPVSARRYAEMASPSAHLPSGGGRRKQNIAAAPPAEVGGSKSEAVSVQGFIGRPRSELGRNFQFPARPCAMVFVYPLSAPPQYPAALRPPSTRIRMMLRSPRAIMSSPTAVGTFVLATVANRAFADMDDHAFGYAANGAKFLVEYTIEHHCCDDVIVHSYWSVNVGEVSADQRSDWSELPRAVSERNSSYWEERGHRERCSALGG
ncbi:unnamed protein product [Prorocentrum cordatum]|uniref:Transmembrane 9 superfamily member n=1 Tax=Prorocentrum cordatum TaxID=2364126 RepID=A0ABN9X7Q8_9DINO|nr:unnamed protein product [Polarella glacialis]